MRWLSFFAAAGLLMAQDPAFEVATIKLNTDCGKGGRAPDGPSPGRLVFSCIHVRDLIGVAYSDFVNGGMPIKRMDVAGGPGWLNTDLYDISAKADGNAPLALMAGPMLRRLLEERFQLKAHKEAKDQPVYTLTVAKNGPKLKPSVEGTCVPMDMSTLKRPAPGQPMPKYCGAGAMRVTREGLLTADWYGVSMAEFSGRMLASNVERPVIDKTGLTGRYDIHLEYVNEKIMSGPVKLNGVESLAAPPAGDGPSIFTALQEQLGLRLSPDRAPVEVIVVDSVEKPSEN